MLSCSLSVKSADDGASGVFACELTVESQITATLEENIYPITDMYSTQYEASYSLSALKTEADHRYISQSLNIRQNIEFEDGLPDNIIDVSCETADISCRTGSTGEIDISGKLIYMIAAVKDGEPMFIEKSKPFDASAVITGITDESTVSSEITVSAVSYSIGEDGIETRCSLLMQGSMHTGRTTQVITKAEIDETAVKQKTDDYALKLYFADTDEDIWNIAKRYNTSAKAIEAENEITDGKASGLLLIPII